MGGRQLITRLTADFRAEMLVSVTQSSIEKPTPPDGNRVHPLVALFLSVSLATATGPLTDWPTAITVFLAVLGVFSAAHTN
jgi:hypothetical protein